MKRGDLVKLTKRAKHHASRSVFEGGAGQLGIVVKPEWNILSGEGMPDSTCNANGCMV